MSIDQLILYVTSEEVDTPSIEAQIEIASRVLDNKKDLVLGLRVIDVILRKGKIKSKYHALCLIEIISKNGNIKIHEPLTNKKFLDGFMLLLKRKRGKAGILAKKEKGTDKIYKEKAEQKALYLIQLWADTFMMHQDRFSGVHECYKQLRLEKVEFPNRETNERLMMENLIGIDSPMFDFVEQTAGKERPKDLEEIKKERPYEEPDFDFIPENGVEEDIQAFDDKEDFSTYNSVNLL
jgi:hypothetical protein